MLRIERRRLRIALRMTLAIAMVAFGLSVCWWGYKQLVSVINEQFGITSYRVTYANVYKEGLSKTIDEWFVHMHETGLLKVRERSSLTDELLKKFPLIASIGWTTYIPGRLDCVVRGVKPVYRINDTYIAGDNGMLYEQKDFGHFGETLPRVMVSNEWVTSSVFASVYRFLKGLNPDLIDGYTIHYQDPYYIVLVPHAAQEDEDTYLCIVDEQSAHLVPTTGKMQQLCQDVKERKEGEEGACLFDFRFEKRIISKVISMHEYQRFARGVR